MSKVTLLVMDDEPAMGRLMQEVVGYLGFDVRVTPNAEDGLALAERLAPDLILLSLRMPGMEPARVCERLRTLEATAETPVLLLSNRPPSGDLSEEAALGARYVSQKPFLANDFAADLYHLSHAGFRLPPSSQELLRVTRILPEPAPVEAPAEAVEARADGGNPNGNGRQPEAVEAVESGPEAERQPEEAPGRRHLRRFAQREAGPGRELEELLAEVRAIRQTSVANAYRIKAVVAVLEEAGLVTRGAVDRAMHQAMRDARNGS